jgi:serine phosphatase RsbU (regulator of sigma subunit)
MAVEPERSERAGLDPGALEALADAGRAAARGARLGDVLRAVVRAAAGLTGADVVLARIVDADRRELVVRAVAGPSAALAVELEGGRLPLDELPRGEVGLGEAPEPVARLAERLGAESVLVVPVIVGEKVHGSVELLRLQGGFDESARTAARLVAAQVGLAARAFGTDEREDGSPESPLRVAADAFAAGSDTAHSSTHVLRLAIELSGAEEAALWRLAPDGRPELDAAVGTGRKGRSVPTVGVLQRGARWSVTRQLGEPAFGLLELVFPPEVVPGSDLVEQVSHFATRAAHALRASTRAGRIEAELAQTRALLAVVGQANQELSLAHTLEAATEQLGELVGADRLAVYLLEDGGLTTAAARGLAGPHLRAAEGLLELALGPYRARGVVTIEDTATEPRLAAVADALAEAGIESATALPLAVGEDVIGLLAVYPTGRSEPSAGELELLSAIAARFAVAVQNARLHEEATRLGGELEQSLASERAAARRLGALYEISSSFAQSLSLDVTLEAVVRTVVELLEVDAAVLRMPDPRREQLLPLALHVAEDSLLGPVRSMLFRPQAFGGARIQRLFRGGESIAIDVATAQELGGSHALLVPFLEKGSTAAIVPIATPAEVLGSLTLLSVRPDHPVDESTIASAVAIAGQAALAIDNARLYQQQKDFSDAMQRSLLPQVRPAVEGLDVGEVYAASAHVEVGGDLYDYMALADGRLAVVLGDVTGHGIDAAADMAMAKFVFRSLAREHPEPGDFLAAANEVVVGEIAPGKFITMLYLLIDAATGVVSVASAGHPPPRLIAADGSVGGIEARGLALGVESGVEYEVTLAQLEPGGSVVLYTDGVIEARRAAEFYGEDRLDALLERRHALRAEDIAASVIQSARRFTGGELLDDCAVVVLKRRA